MNVASGRPPTAADVAARAGVSRPTVSHILNGRGGSFSPETRERVMLAAKALDYRPSPAGRSLVRGRGETIVVLIPNSTIGQNQQDALDRLIADTADIGGNVVLRFADADWQSTTTALLRLRPLAVVDLGALPPPARERLAQQGVPTVPRFDGVARDELRLDVGLSELQVRELTRHGPRPIIYAGLLDARPDPFSPLRFLAVQRVCDELGLPAPRLVEVPPDPDGALAALRDLIRDSAVGVAAYNDTVAAAVASAATRLGRDIPSDVAIVGVDATPLAQLFTPRLTTIAVNMSRYIDRAVEDLSEELSLPIAIPERVGVGSLHLIRGDSS